MFGLTPKQLIRLAIIACAIYAISQYLPAYFYHFEFDDSVKQEVQFAALRRKTTQELRTAILQKASDFYRPVESGNIKITQKGTTLTVDVTYSVPINLFVYKHELRFESRASGESLAP